MENRIVTTFEEYTQGANPTEEGMAAAEMVDPTVIEKLVDIVGSEEDVESAAKEAFEELKASFEKNEMEIEDGDAPESLAMAALVLKLVEMGKLGPQEADSFIEENFSGSVEAEDTSSDEGEEGTPSETNEWRSYRRIRR